MWRVSRPCAACRCCGGFCDRCSGVFSASVSLPCSQPAGWPPFFVWPALPPPGGCVRDFPLVRPRSVALFPARVPCRLPLLCEFSCSLPICLPCALFRLVLTVCSSILCRVRVFSLLSLSFFCLTSSSQNFFHLSLRPRRASTFFRKESRQRFAKGLRPFEPHSCALRPIFSFSSLLAGLTTLRAANRRLTGKRLKSQGAELSFSSVSVRRGTSAPFRRSPPFSRCWPAYAAFRPQFAG